MSLFALPITASSTSRQSAETRSIRYKVNLPFRKRKRGSESPPLHVDDEDEGSLSDGELPVTSTNPLSLAPDEILQYRLAGLELDKQLPSAKDFPHAGLPATPSSTYKKKKDVKGKGRAVDTSDEEGQDTGLNAEDEGEDGNERSNQKPPQGSKLRLQHLRVLVAILHKCLLEGDIKRALRAWSMLIRVQYDGRMLDIRSTGYWAIGVELLARSGSGEQLPRHANDLDDEGRSTAKVEGGEKEWGTKEGRAKAVSYLGSMVLEFPLNKVYPRAISAIDFWPSMLAIEIYGIQFEHKEALRVLTLAAEEVGSEEDSESEVDEESGYMENYDPFAAADRKRAKRQHKKEEKIWQKREEIRKSTLAAAQSLASRVDELLSGTLYATNLTISEIRAHIAIYIGDLSVPNMPLEVEDDEESDSSQRRPRSEAGTERRMLYRQRLNEHEAGKRKRKEEIERATTIVKKILKNGGDVDDFKDLELGIPVDDFNLQGD